MEVIEYKGAHGDRIIMGNERLGPLFALQFGERL